MTVKEYLDQNNPKKYVITDRVRIPIKEDELKYIDLNTIEVRKVEEIGDLVKIHTDYSADQC